MINILKDALTFSGTPSIHLKNYWFPHNHSIETTFNFIKKVRNWNDPLLFHEAIEVTYPAKFSM